VPQIQLADIVHLTSDCIIIIIITFANKVMFLPDFVCLFVCLSVCQQDNSKSYGRIFLKFSGNVGNGVNYQ